MQISDEMTLEAPRTMTGNEELRRKRSLQVDKTKATIGQTRLTDLKRGQS